MERIWNELARYNYFSAFESDVASGQTTTELADGKLTQRLYIM